MTALDLLVLGIMQGESGEDLLETADRMGYLRFGFWVEQVQIARLSRAPKV